MTTFIRSRNRTVTISNNENDTHNCGIDTDIGIMEKCLSNYKFYLNYIETILERIQIYNFSGNIRKRNMYIRKMLYKYQTAQRVYLSIVNCVTLYKDQIEILKKKLEQDGESENYNEDVYKKKDIILNTRINYIERIDIRFNRIKDDYDSLHFIIDIMKCKYGIK